MNNFHFTDLRLPPWLQDADDISRGIQTTWDALHSKKPIRIINQENRSLFQQIIDSDRTLAHLRITLLGLPMAMLAARYLEREAPQYHHNRIMKRLRSELAGSPEPDSDVEKMDASKDVDSDEHEATYEKKVILNHAMKIGDDTQCVESVRALLQISLFQSALTTGNQGPTDRFNWFLIDVVPSAYHLRLPMAYYEKRWPMDFDDPFNFGELYPEPK